MLRKRQGILDYNRNENLIGEHMHRILILEDDMIQGEMIKHWIQEKYGMWKIDMVNDYHTAMKALLDSLSETPYTLFLLDVNLKSDSDNRDGFLFAQELRTKRIYYRTPILFLTQVQTEGLHAYTEFHCYNYITKPYTKDVILGQIEQMLLTDYLSSTIIISDTSKINHQFFVNDILYVRAHGPRKEIILKKSRITTRKRLSEIITLSNNLLIQCHKSYLVNPNYITSIDRQNKYLNINSEVIPLSKTYLDSFDFLNES